MTSTWVMAEPGSGVDFIQYVECKRVSVVPGR